MTYKEILDLFTELCYRTVSHGYEPMLYHTVLRYMPSHASYWIDDMKNLHVVIQPLVGEPSCPIMWSCHLDTCTIGPPCETGITILHDKEERPFFHCTPSDDPRDDVVLGADCHTGTALMCFMMQADIPGWYTFYAGEEQGCIGSSHVADHPEHWPFHPEKAIAFDRCGTGDIVATQMGERCVSRDFSSYVAERSPFNWSEGNGSYTDTAMFIESIAECTNISVGYYHQHTDRECQDIGYMVSLIRWIVDDEGWKVFRDAPAVRDPATTYKTGSSWMTGWGQGTTISDAPHAYDCACDECENEVLEDLGLTDEDLDDWDMNNETFDQWVARRQHEIDGTSGDPHFDQTERDRELIESLDTYRERV